MAARRASFLTTWRVMEAALTGLAWTGELLFGFTVARLSLTPSLAL